MNNTNNKKIPFSSAERFSHIIDILEKKGYALEFLAKIDEKLKKI